MAIKIMTDTHKTAITRTSISAPMTVLDKKGLLCGDMLDYGCGKGFDADHFGMDRYDPHYTNGVIEGHNGLARKTGYDTITCNYVLNVIESEIERKCIVIHIKSLLNKGGMAYITVRRDVKTSGATSIGTYQDNVMLDFPILYEKAGKFCIYVVKK